MDEIPIRNRLEKIVGNISSRSDGKLEIRNAKGQLRGSYDLRTDKTRDHTGRIIGNGNLLLTLIDLKGG